jgi:UDP-N-acetylglucosamine--N-acetylmuramyl-(pentapeptide) pyrophosphoryl-undecaprenol N-acetylglucosamine transferase
LKFWSEQRARQTFGLSQDLPTLLVIGGSKGSRSINRALFSILPELLKQVQIIHVSGHLDWHEVAEAKESLDQLDIERYHAYPYLHEEIGAALKIADLVLSRAGASILGEYPLFGTPAILVPYPYAWRYQEVNAEYLVKNGAAILLEEKFLASNLLLTIQELLQDGFRREEMRRAMSNLAHPMATESIVNLLYSLAASPGLGRM